MNNNKNIRKRQCIILFAILLPVFMYVSWSLSALATKENISIENLRKTAMYYLSHFRSPDKNNEKTPAFLGVGLLTWGMCFLTYYIQMSYNLMHGREYGTAEWGSIKAFNKKYASEIEQENKILSENIRMKYDASTLRNNNTFIVGGSGAGKTAFMVTPNALNNHGSMVYTDPKGGLLADLGNALNNEPYTRVWHINLCEMEKSMRINPFDFIRKRSDVSRLINNIVLNTTPAEQGKGGDPFWDRAEKLYLESIFLYVWMECPRTELDENGDEKTYGRNFETVIRLLDEAKVSDDGIPSQLDIRFNTLKEKNPRHPVLLTYRRFMAAAGDTLRSIIICANSRFNQFDDPEIYRILSETDIRLDEIGIGLNGDGKTKTHLFIIIPDDDDTYNFIPGMIYTLLFQELYYQARLFNGNKLPLDVGMWFDEFANIKMPEHFDKILATCRSRGIYCVPILQSLAQIKQLFKDGAWEGIVGNCDTFVYLGGNEQSTHKYISELLGKWTIDKRTSGQTRGKQGSSNIGYDVLGRDLIDPAEMRLLPNEKCIIFVRGEKPMIDEKWYPWKQQVYKAAKKLGVYEYDPKIVAEQGSVQDNVLNISDEQEEYYLKLMNNSENLMVYDFDPVGFMKLDLDLDDDEEMSEEEILDIIKSIPQEVMEENLNSEKQQYEQEEEQNFLEAYEKMSLMDIYISPFFEQQRKDCMKKLTKLGIDDNTIKDIVAPDNPLNEVIENVKMAVEYYS